VIEHFLANYGYLVLFLGVALEGETFLLTAAYLASRGFFHLEPVMLVALAANSIADQVYYALARWKGRPWLDARFGQHPRYQWLIGRIERRASFLLLVSRYAFGLRIAIPAACGVVGMPPARFTVVNVLAGAIWVVPTALLGYWFGHSMGMLTAEMRRYEAALGLALLSAVLAWLLWRTFRRYPELWSRSQRWLFHTSAPMVVGFMGALNILSAIRPRAAGTVRAVETWFPLEVTQRSRPLMLLAGVALLHVSRGLFRRKQTAWMVAVVALSVSLLLHITRALDLHYSLVSGLLLAYLWTHRRRFHALSDPVSVRRTLLLAPALGVLIFVYGWIGLQNLRAEFRWQGAGSVSGEAFRVGILIREPRLDPATAHAARFLGSLQVGGWLARAYLLILLLRPVILRRRAEAPAETVRRLFAEHSVHGLGAYAVQPDKHHLLVAGDRAFVAFAAVRGVALSCGDPVGPADALPQAVAGFHTFCERHGWTPCFYEVAERNLAIYRDRGYQCLKMAEEAVIPLSSFGLTGSRRANLRHTVTKAQKLGLRFAAYDPARADPEVEEEMEEISEQWLATKKGPEMGFTLGRFSLEALTGVPVTLCFSAGRLEAFTSWLPYRQNRGLYLDLMRKRDSAPFGTMDFLLTHSLLHFREQGYEVASMANAPLANTAAARAALDRGVAFLFEHFNQIYGYKNLFQFKKKFDPAWEGRYLAYPRLTALPKVAYAIVNLHSSGGILQYLRRAS